MYYLHTVDIVSSVLQKIVFLLFILVFFFFQSLVPAVISIYAIPTIKCVTSGRCALLRKGRALHCLLLFANVYSYFQCSLVNFLFIDWFLGIYKMHIFYLVSNFRYF